MKRLLIIFLLGIVSLNASSRELDQSEISLQGSLSFADIINESKKQLGIKVVLPLKADDQARMDYNQVITLRQLAQAVVVHFAQDDIPLSWNYESKALSFERKDLRPKDRKWTAKESSKTSKTATSSAPKKYPVPTIRNPPVEQDYPTMPTWAQQKTVSNRVNERIVPIAELPSLTQSGVSSPSWSTGSTSSSSSSTSFGSVPTISQDTGSFAVTIPQKPRQVTRPEPTLDTFESPSRPRQPDLGGSNSSNWSSTSQPSSIGSSPSYRAPKTSPTEPRRGGFNITPYPEGAVAFINDAPSIVPGAAKEGFIEWATRLRGALREGNRMVLESEKDELERRLRWLNDHLK